MFKNIFKKEAAGIYFSSKGVTIVQESMGKVRNVLSQPYPPREGAEEGIVSDDIFEIFKNRDMELMAFLQKAIRDSKLETADVVVALPPKDLIIRFFEIPNIPRSEIGAGINFEMKKYIPFKIEELAYDHQYRVKPKSNIVEVIVCGIRQAPLVSYEELFKQLNLRVVAFEPGLFSLFRLLVTQNKLSSQKSCVVLEFDKEEANIMIVDHGFSYFTRDIRLASPAGVPASSEEGETVLFRLINEVRVSLDYFRRQFLRKDVDEMVVVAENKYAGFAEHFSKELGLKVRFVPFSDLAKVAEGREDMMADASKAFGAALRVEKPFLVTLNLVKAKEKAGPPVLGGIVSEAQIDFVSNFFRESKAALIRGGIVGAVIIVVAYGLGFSKAFPLEKEYAAAVVKQPPLMPGVDVSSLEGAKASELSLIDKERSMKKLVEGYAPVYEKLLALSHLLPQGVWLINFMYSNEPKTAELSCASYADDEKMRSGNINQFFANLKSSAEFGKEFSLIDLKSFREVNQGDSVFMQFDIHCEAKTS